MHCASPHRKRVGVFSIAAVRTHDCFCAIFRQVEWIGFIFEKYTDYMTFDSKVNIKFT